MDIHHNNGGKVNNNKALNIKGKITANSSINNGSNGFVNDNHVITCY